MGRRRMSENAHQYTVNGVNIPVVKSIKDLGVFISSDLSFSVHCSKIAAKASQSVGLIFRAFVSHSLSFMVKMFTSRVRPIMEYKCELWSPHLLGDIDKIESVQRSFTKRINGLYNLSYQQRLKICNLEPLELRRMKRDLIFVYKIRHSLVKLNFLEFFRLAPTVGTRGHSEKLYAITVSTDRSLASFPNRVVNSWNKLPENVVKSPTLFQFKANLEHETYNLIPMLRGRAFRNSS